MREAARTAATGGRRAHPPGVARVGVPRRPVVEPLGRGVDFWGRTSRVKRPLPIGYGGFGHAHNTQKHPVARKYTRVLYARTPTFCAHPGARCRKPVKRESRPPKRDLRQNKRAPRAPCTPTRPPSHSTSCEPPQHLLNPLRAPAAEAPSPTPCAAAVGAAARRKASRLRATDGSAGASSV